MNSSDVRYTQSMFVPARRLNLDVSNKCTLECPKCSREIYKQLKQKIPGKMLQLPDFVKLTEFFTDYIQFCGSVSDPIMNPLLPTFLQMCYDKKIQCSVATSATSIRRPKEWYSNCFNLNPNCEWVFGIDGLPDQSHWYRKNQDGEFLFEVMKMGAAAGLNVVWQYIVFKYNETTIDAAREMAKQYGIRFEIRLSHRWDVPYDMYKPTNPAYVENV